MDFERQHLTYRVCQQKPDAQNINSKNILKTGLKLKNNYFLVFPFLTLF